MTNSHCQKRYVQRNTTLRFQEKEQHVLLSNKLKYMNWFQPAWDALSEDDRFVLDTFFCSESKYGSGAADAVSDHFSIERSSAYRKKNRALENLTTLLYGKG